MLRRWSTTTRHPAGSQPAASRALPRKASTQASRLSTRMASTLEPPAPLAKATWKRFPTSKPTVRSYCGWSSPASGQACGVLNMAVSFRACPPIMHPHRDARLATPTLRAAAGLGKLARHVPVGRLRRTCRPRRQHPPGLRKRQGTRAARGRPVGSPKGPPKHTPLRQEMNKGRPLRACPGL